MTVVWMFSVLKVEIKTQAMLLIKQICHQIKLPFRPLSDKQQI